MGDEGGSGKGSGIEAEVFVGREGLENLLREYRGFYGRAKFQNGFQSAGWIGAWYRTLGRRFRPVVVVVREDGVWKMVWPFFEVQFPMMGRALWPAGADVNDLFDPVMDGEEKEWVVCGLKELLRGWQFVWLPLLSEDFVKLLGEGEVSGMRFCLRRRAVRLMVDLVGVGDFERYRREIIPGEMRSLVERRGRKMKREGGRVEAWRNTVSRRELLRVVDRIIEVGKKTWQTEAKKGPFRDAENREFYRLALVDGVEEGVSRLSGMWIRDELVSFEVGFLHNSFYSMHTTGFLQDFWDYSPGTLLMFSNLRWCFEEGLLFYDFLQNDQGYKRAFATREENLYDLVVMRAGIWSVGFEFFLRFSGFVQRWWKGKRDRRGMGKGRNFAEEERR